jgi:hypothetical protein
VKTLGQTTVGLDLATIGQAGATLLDASEDEWIHRRVESLAVGPELLSRRHVSIDFTVPGGARAAGQGPFESTVCYLPLSFLQKRPSLIWFDLRDEADQPIPLLTLAQTLQADREALQEFARIRLERDEFPGELTETVKQIVFAPITSARDALRNLVAPSATALPEWVNSEARRGLASDHRFLDLAKHLAVSTLLWVPITLEPGRRRVVKLAYEVATPNRLLLRKTFGAFFGWPQTYWVQGENMGNLSSYHLTVLAAPYLEITSAKLVVAQEPQPQIETQVERRVVHFHLTGTRVDAASVAQVSVRVERQGYLSSAALTCFLIGSMFLIVRHWAWLALPPSRLEPTVTILLVVPAILAALLARPAYVLSDLRLILGLRTMLSFVGVLAVYGAIAAIAYPIPTARAVMLSIGLITFAIGIIHAVAFLLPLRKRPGNSRTV